MRFSDQAQRIHNASNPERKKMTDKERKDGIAKIKKRLSSEGLYELHDQVEELFENLEEHQTESDERFQKLIA
jgi:hypothetical protein